MTWILSRMSRSCAGSHPMTHENAPGRSRSRAPDATTFGAAAILDHWRRPAVGAYVTGHDRLSACFRNNRLGLLLAALLVLDMPVWAQAPRGAPGEGDAKIDFALARREIQAFETVLNDMIAAAFSSSPFALVQKTKGVYLPGYGTSFNFLINIHRAMVSTPFGEIRRFENTSPEQKRKRIEDMTERLVRTLLEYGSYLTQLSKDESVAIVAFYEDRNFPDEANQNKTVVISATKRDLEEFAGNQNRLKEFRQRVKIIEY